MSSLSETSNTPSLFSSACDVAQGKFLPHIAKEESHYVQLPCKEEESALSCKTPDVQGFIDEVNGLDLNTVIAKPINLVIPKIVPIIDRALFDFPAVALQHDVVGISLKDIFSSTPQQRYGRIHVSPIRIREHTLDKPIFQNKKRVLFSSGRDVLIEQLWQDLYPLNLPEVLSRMGITAMTGFNFSVFPQNCALGQAVNMKKSLETVRIFQEAGIEVIPHIYFLHTHHLRRWVEWLQKNQLITTVTINCQFTREHEFAKLIAEGIDFLRNNVGRKIQFLLEGPSRFLLRELNNLGCAPYVSVAIKQPSMDALFGGLYTIENGRFALKRTQGIPRNELLGINFTTYEEYVRTFIFNSSILDRLRTPRKPGISVMPYIGEYPEREQ